MSAILGKLQLGKVSVILGKERSSLQLGKVSVILGKERILSFLRKGVVCNWERIQSFGKASKGERKGFRPSQKKGIRVAKKNLSKILSPVS